VRGAALALAAAALAAGCVGRRVETAAAPEPAPAADPAQDMADLDLRIECDRVRMQVPERLRGELGNRQKCNLPPFLVTVRRVVVVIREDVPVVEVGGEDFSVLAEGGVRTTRREGASIVEEGPYQILVLRNGRMLRR